MASFVAYRYASPQPTANYGELVLPPERVPSQRFDLPGGGIWSFAELQGRWALVVADDADCPAACVGKLTTLRQVQLALGRRASRVGRVMLVTGGAAPNPALGREFEGTVVAALPRGAAPTLGALADRGYIHLVDPHGNVMMRWPAAADRQRMLRDLERLLKASQIGHNDGLVRALPC